MVAMVLYVFLYRDKMFTVKARFIQEVEEFA